MPRNTRVEIICAEAERFRQTPSVSEPQGLNAAAELAKSLELLPSQPSSGFFARRWKSLRDRLEPLLDELQRPSEAASEELRWLQENTRLLRNALQETDDLCKSRKKVPTVRDFCGRIAPRVVALAEAYLDAAEYRFDGAVFVAYAGEFEEVTVLNVKEIWRLAPCLKLVLLETVAERAAQLLKNPAGIYGIPDCMRSLHLLAQTSWKELLEPLIAIDRVLRDDPAHAYAAMDFASRELYWNAVANVAEYSDFSEMEVASTALTLASEARNKKNGFNPRRTSRRNHVGFYLLGEGSAVLEAKASFKPPLGQKIARLLQREPTPYYLGGIALLTLTVMAIALSAITDVSMPRPLLLAIFILFVPCSQAAVELMNYLTTSLLPVRVLPKLDFSEGIPANCLTMVAVPALLLNEAQVRRLAEDLEVRYLGNRDSNLHFFLLTDLPDSKERPREDDPLVTLCAELIGKLNEKYASHNRGSFFLLHRHRVYNPREGTWMGWERKRGKLMDFYRLLREKYDAFPVKVGDLTLLSQVRFVITLDSDTELPRGSAQRMVGALAHPLNQAIIDPQRNVVVAGYGILQPRIGVSVQSASSSRLANIYSGQTGLDLYTRAVSDVYQDLYGEGIFTGKGICEVDALLHVLEHRFPDNALLSHDLIEGAYARAGLASDIELIDDYPSHYSAHNRRKHRWMRGDWQIMGWLRGRVPDATGKKVRNPISLVSRWKILDNLRRSLVDPAFFLVLVLGWFVLPGSPLRWTLAAILLMFAPSWLQFASAILRAAWKRNLTIARGAFTALLTADVGVLLRLTFLAHQALLSFDAIVRVLVRRLVTRRGLLEWETAAEAELGNDRRTLVDRYLDWTPAVAVLLGLLLWPKRPVALLLATPILLLWAGSKLIARWLNKPPRAVGYEMPPQDRWLLRRVALRTWRYFTDCTTEEHHWLIPDNFQQEPVWLAARTSPTNLGLLLNARQVACELGYLTLPEFAESTSRTLASIERLPKYNGHLFNWYDTRTLEPLPPRFVSSADSGNLVASLWSLQQGCLERLSEPILSTPLLEGFIDCVLEFDPQNTATRAVAKTLPRQFHPADWLPQMRQLADALPAELDPSAGDDSDLRWFHEQARARRDNVMRTVLLYCPWLLPEFSSLRENPALQLKAAPQEPSLEHLPAFIDAAAARLACAIPAASAEQQPVYRSLQALLAQARQNTDRIIRELRMIAAHAGRLAHDMDFGFLYNRWRKLLSVGFDVESEKLHGACYDLLASEARLALFVAIAKEEVPQESWFLMGRPHARNGDRPVLLSWTGTMFEYLMPALWMRTYPNTLLERARVAAVRSQQEFAARKHIPWGISESAHAKRDEAGNYQYRAFGLPSLAVHKDQTEELVISPYSTLLALSIDPAGSLANLRRICKEGWLGIYGFYEAADFTPGLRAPRRHAYELVRCWMAHHQGMSLLAIGNLFYDGLLQRWFHNNPRVQATELLLQEKPVAAMRLRSAQQDTAAA